MQFNPIRIGDNQAISTASIGFLDAFSNTCPSRFTGAKSIHNDLELLNLFVGTLISELFDPQHSSVDSNASISFTNQFLSCRKRFVEGCQQQCGCLLTMLENRPARRRGCRGLEFGTAGCATGHTCSREEDSQVIVYLRRGRHRRPGIGTSVPLIYGDGRGDPLDAIDLCSIHLPNKSTGVGGETLDVTSLPLGKQDVKGKSALP